MGKIIGLIFVASLLTACGNASTTTPASAANTAVGISTTGTTTTVPVGVVPEVVYSLNNPVFGVTPLSANGTTSVSVLVNANGVVASNPTEVLFTSGCVTAGKAKLTPSAFTSSGTAVATYLDQGCAGTDVVTATVSTDNYSYSSSATLTVLAPDVGSIRFVSASPTNITLKGVGGAGRQETSRVTFQIVDVAGNPVAGKTVNLSLTTSVGGLGLINATATSDAQGFAVVDVTSGVVATPVRVKASTTGVGGVLITTQSDLLTVSTGTPDQTSFSLVADTLNIEGWNFDGGIANLTVRLSDHFNNPVPDGTAVSFTAESGQIVGNCAIAAGQCSVTLTSSGLRPSDGRVTVLAYADGDESFRDINGNGYVDSLAERVDINGANTDLQEAFMDQNEDGVYNTGEYFPDFNNNGAHDLVDGVYNGLLCKIGVSSECPSGTASSLHVFNNIVITFSGSSPTITGVSPAPPLDLTCNGSVAYTFTVSDLNGNPMPRGTTIDVITTNGKLGAPSSFTVGSSNLNIATSPTNPVFRYSVSLSGDGTAAPCVDTTLSGTMTITVTTPNGTVSAANVAVIN